MDTSTNPLLTTVGLLLFTLQLVLVHSQIPVDSNIFDSLDKLSCKRFKNIILKADLQERYQSVQAATVFVFSDEAYDALPPSRLGSLYENTERGPRNYVQSFTLDRALETSSFSDAKPYLSELSNGGHLFLNKRRLSNTASGRPGVTRYFVNGAMITKANIRAGNQIIHIIDRVLDMPLTSKALAYPDGYNPKARQFKFYKELMVALQRSATTDTEINYSNQVRRILLAEQVTFFLPTDAAMDKIPKQRLDELVGNEQKLMEVVTLHIVPGKVLYTSLVNHNEPFTTQKSSGRIIFRKNFDKEAVYVTGARIGGGTVTARVSPANITVENGVIHQIDEVLGFVYKSAIEEIQSDVESSNFESIITTGRNDLKQALAASSGVTVFVPTNNAMNAIANVYENYITNTSLINRVLELSLLRPGPPFSLTSYNRGYRSMLQKESRYNGRRIKIYSEGNDTWVEGGYVRARVIKPDIGVTNGFVHLIDAVFGIPTRDVVYTIFCNDWLYRTYNALKSVQMDKYLADPNLRENQQCSFRSGESGSSAGVPNTNRFSNERCGDNYYRCRFTFFVPNGTAIENFEQTSWGQDVMNDKIRWRWLMRRLMTRRKEIYLDQLALGAPHYYVADNGEEVYIQVTGSNQYTSSQRTAYISFGNVKAEIIRSDIGATNGVIHIIDNILFTPADLTRDVSAGHTLCVSLILVLLSSMLVGILTLRR